MKNMTHFLHFLVNNAKSSYDFLPSLLISGMAALGFQPLVGSDPVSSKFIEVIGVGVLLVILLNQIFAFIRFMKNGNTPGNNQVVTALEELKKSSQEKLGELTKEIQELRRDMRDVLIDQRESLVKLEKLIERERDR
jgi:hypothetical protein